MRFRHPAWEPIAWLLAAVNVASVWFAAIPGEPMHATGHAVLAVGFALGARALTARRRAELLIAEQEALLDHAEESEQLFDGMQARVLELEEQLEFAERLLAQHRAVDGTE